MPGFRSMILDETADRFSRYAANDVQHKYRQLITSYCLTFVENMYTCTDIRQY